MEIGELRKAKTLVFKTETDPLMAVEWLRQMNRRLDALGVPMDRRVRLASQFLEEAALDWYETEYLIQGPEAFLWEHFETAFIEKYVPQTAREAKAEEFLHIQQDGTMSVSEFTAKFDRLARFGKIYIKDEAAKVLRYRMALHPSISSKMAVVKTSSYAEIVTMAKMAEKNNQDAKRFYEIAKLKRGEASASDTGGGKRQRFDSGKERGAEQQGHRGQGGQPRRGGGQQGRDGLHKQQGGDRPYRQQGLACFACGQMGHKARDCRRKPQGSCYHCGQMGHQFRDCPRLRGGAQQRQQGQQTRLPPPQGQQQRALPPAGRGRPLALPPPPAQPQQVAQGRVYALGHEAAPADQPYIGGTYLLFSSWCRVLFDSGATHSFIAAPFVSALGLSTVPMGETILVESPLGKNIRVHDVCRNCVIRFENHGFRVDLIVMEFRDFDVILGMNWLSENRVVLDCYERRVTVRTAEGALIRVRGTKGIPYPHFLDNPSYADCMVANLALSTP